MCWRRVMRTLFWWGKLKNGDHMKEPDVGRNIFLKMSLNNTPRISCYGHELDIS
jgi:hypothetical protein